MQTLTLTKENEPEGPGELCKVCCFVSPELPVTESVVTIHSQIFTVESVQSNHFGRVSILDSHQSHK